MPTAPAAAQFTHMDFEMSDSSFYIPVFSFKSFNWYGFGFAMLDFRFSIVNYKFLRSASTRSRLTSSITQPTVSLLLLVSDLHVYSLFHEASKAEKNLIRIYVFDLEVRHSKVLTRRRCAFSFPPRGCSAPLPHQYLHE